MEKVDYMSNQRYNINDYYNSRKWKIDIWGGILP
jgi:hypothetical protein